MVFHATPESGIKRQSAFFFFCLLHKTRCERHRATSSPILTARVELHAETKRTHMGEVQLSLRLWQPGMRCGFTGFINNRQKQADTKGAAVLSRTTLAEHPLRPPGYRRCLAGAVSTGARPTRPACMRIYPCSSSISSRSEYRQE